MPPRPWLQAPGGIFHVCSRGTEGRLVYLDDPDRRDFLFRLRRAVDRFEWRCHAYCLMSNHFHLLVETPAGNLPQGMHLLSGGYATRFNMRYERVGHLFQARYRAVVVNSDAQFVQTAAYIDLNPVRAGVTRRPGDWPWSSYGALTGTGSRPDFLTVSGVLDCFDARRRRAAARYAEFVAEKQLTDKWDTSFEGMD